MTRLLENLLLAIVCVGMVIWSPTSVIAQTDRTSAEFAVEDSYGPTVFPDRGGQGTTLSITSKYGGFGKIMGKVLVSRHPCRVLSWSDGFISAKITADLEVGVYDVTVRPVKDDPLVIPHGFEVLQPSINSTGPIEVMAGTTYTISTVNLPPQKGEAFLVLNGGPLIPCPILRWTPEMVRIKIPTVSPETYDLVLTTEDGHLTAKSLFLVRPLGDEWDYSWKGYFETTMTGITYGGKICRFVSGYDDDVGIHYDISDRPDEHRNRGRLVDQRGVAPVTRTYVMPAAINDRLYLFWVIPDGDAFEYTWTNNVAIPQPTWAPLKRIENFHIRDGARPNVLFNPKSKTIFIYFRTKQDTIGVMSGTDLVHWDYRELRFSEVGHESVFAINAPSVTMNSLGEIMVARQVGDDVHVTKSKDPFFTSRDSTVWFSHIKNAPWIQSLGQGQVALAYQDRDNNTNILVYTDSLGTWNDRHQIDDSHTFRGPTTMPVFAEYHDDPNRGEGLELKLWFFFFNHENVYSRYDRDLGELRLKEKEETDWTQIGEKMGLTGEDALEFNLNVALACPLVGIVDNPPPCALNNNTTADQNKSQFTFTNVDQTSKSVKMDWKVGAFVTTGPMVPVVYDIHAGVQGAYSSTTTTSNSITYRYPPNYAPGKISAIHAVPVTLARKFLAYRNGVQAVETPIIVLQVINTSLLQFPVDPPTNKLMVRHAAGDLRSYTPNVGGYEKTSYGGTWAGNAAATIQLAASTTESNALGFNFNVKGGGQIPTIVSFGYEGSYSVDYKNETTTSNNWALTLDNPPATKPNDIKAFVATLLLLHPPKDPNNHPPYWVPDYVIQGRNAAWFVTYDIGVIQYE
jgi:hypothetical protein